MAYIKIDNDDNQVLIDDTYENYMLVRTVTVNFSGGTAESTASFQYQGHALSAPIYAVLLEGQSAMPTDISRSASHLFTVKVVTERRLGGSVTILIYDRPVPDYIGTGNVVVRNEDGRVTFDSDKNYMRVVSTFSAGGATTIAVPSAGRLALVYASPRVGYAVRYVGIPVPPSGWIYEYQTTFSALLAARSGGSLTLRVATFYYRATTSNPGPPPAWGTDISLTPGHYMLLDVTGQL